MSGKKGLSPKMAAKIIENLNLSDSENELLLRGLLTGKSKPARKLDVKVLKEDEFSFISEWYHYAILCLGRMTNKADAKWIGNQLGIEPMVAFQAFHRLLRLGFVKVSHGQFQEVTKPLDTTTDIPSKAIRSFHKQNLQLASEKLETITVDKREYSTITMAVAPSQIAAAKKMINEFKHKFCAKMEEANEISEVYTLAIQFFPLTKEKIQ
jgi:uncharacterized protein (TIGR02147 family)